MLDTRAISAAADAESAVVASGQYCFLAGRFYSREDHNISFSLIANDNLLLRGSGKLMHKLQE